MLFAQFEAEINERCETLIRRHKMQDDWRDRRAWEGYDERQVKNIPFKRRLALLMNKGEAVYGDAANLYLERNHIAHGVKVTLDVDMLDAVDIMSAAVAAMEENP